MPVDMGRLPRTVTLGRDDRGRAFLDYVDQRVLPGRLEVVRTYCWREVVGAICGLAVRGAPALGVCGAAAVALWLDGAAESEEGSFAGTYCWREVVGAICGLAVRGAPALGVCGAAAVALWLDGAAESEEGSFAGVAALLEGLRQASSQIASARPTAVNLSWGVSRVRDAAVQAIENGGRIRDVARLAFDEAKAVEAQDEECCRRIGAFGAALLPSREGGCRVLTHCNAGSLACSFYGTALGVVYSAAQEGRIARVYADETSSREGGCRVLTHCNAGSLACSFYGTALGVVYSAAQEGRIARVYADETRPVGQGARLTAWELARAGVPVTLICDNMAASAMAQGMVDAVVVGADRIAANGDVANKIGTLGVAVLAKRFGVPFFVAAPASTVDASLSCGSLIPIEQRDRAEVMADTPEGVEIWNPAFDVTPAELVDAIVTERGVFEPSRILDALEQQE